MPCPYGFDGAAEKIGNGASSLPTGSVDDTLKQRGNIYGDFGVQCSTVGAIVKAMDSAYVDNQKIDRNNAVMGGNVPMNLIAEWNYLAIKLARIAANPDYTDSYHDLAGYATLMERERLPKPPPDLVETGV